MFSYEFMLANFVLSNQSCSLKHNMICMLFDILVISNLLGWGSTLHLFNNTKSSVVTLVEKYRDGITKKNVYLIMELHFYDL